MPISCNGVTQGCLHPTRQRAGRSGYTGAPHVEAIVVHYVGAPEQFRSEMCSCLPQFPCPGPTPCPPMGHSTPQSVHVQVAGNGITQFAELTDTTFGLDYLFEPTWPGLAALLPVSDVNGPFVHVAVDGDNPVLVTAICCVILSLGYPVPIVAASDLQADRPQMTISPTLQALVDACVANGGVTPPPTIGDLADRVEALEQCCLEVRSRLLVVEEVNSTQNARLSALELRATALEGRVTYLEQLTAVIPTLVEQVTILIGQVSDILSRCCPSRPESVCFHYQLLPGSEMLVTPNQPVWLNLPTKVEDREVSCGNGNIVRPGPLWMADLCKSDDCGDVVCGGSWNIEATVRFRLQQWCAGKKVQLYLVACGVKYLMAERVIPSTGSQVVTLQGSFLLPSEPCCSDVHLLVTTNDDNTTSAKVVEFADIKGCCQ